MFECTMCGGREFAERSILWDDLAEAWELSPAERAYIDRQQGTHCTRCGANLRSGALARAVLDAVGEPGPLRYAVGSVRLGGLSVLEINEAGDLSAMLRRLPGHQLATYPEVDMQAMPYADGIFDVVVHSDTLEHVPDPLRALEECRRVLKPAGALCFTVPMIVGRLTRGTAGRPPSYHGNPAESGEDYRVQTEFGADAWIWCMRAGFSRVTITTMEYPAALALTARK